MSPTELQLNTMEGLILKRRSAFDAGDDTTHLDSAIERLSGEMGGVQDQADSKDDSALLAILQGIQTSLEEGIKVKEQIQGPPGPEGKPGPQGPGYTLTDLDIKDIAIKAKELVPKGLEMFTDKEVEHLVAEVASKFRQPEDGKPGSRGEPGKTPEIDYEKLKNYCAEIMQTMKHEESKTEPSNPAKVKYSDIEGAPNFEEIVKRVRKASKTYSIAEMDDVDLSGLTKTNGKYVLGSGTGSAGGTVVTKTADYAVVKADFGNSLVMDSASNKTFTLPTTIAGDVGAKITFIKANTGKVTLQMPAGTKVADSANAGTMYNDLINEDYATITLQLITATKWVVLGGMGTWITT